MATDVGIRIGVEGEREFRTSLSAINSQIRNLNSEMRDVTSAFADMEDSEEAVAAQTEVLKRSITAQEQKLSLLTSQYDRANSKLASLGEELERANREFGENSVEASRAQQAFNRQATVVNQLGSQINATNVDLRNMQRQLRNLEDGAGEAAEEVEDLSQEMEEADRNTSSFAESLKGAFLGGAIAGAVQGMASAISSLVEETLEFRKITGTLATSSQKAGYTTEQTSESFKQLYSIIGDDQQAATALANLQALGLEQAELTKLTDAAIGAWATYGDSIPIDGLAESINETIQAGQVTGTFADVLNWAGTSEDKFNEALEAAPDKAARVNLVMQELAKQGLAETAEAWRQNNKDIVALQAAELSLKQVTAEFGKMVTPIVANIKQGFADILQGALSIITTFQTGGLYDGFNKIGELGTDIAAKISKAIPAAVESLSYMLQQMSEYLDGNIPKFIESGLQIINGFAQSIRDNAPGLINAALDLMETFAKGIADSIPAIVEIVPEIIAALADVINDNAPQILATGVRIIGYLVEGIIKAIPTLIANAPKIIDAIVSVWSAFNWANLGKSAMIKLKDGIASMISVLKNEGTTVLNTIVGVVKLLPNNMSTIAKNGMTSLANGINGMLSAIKAAANSIMTAITGTVKKLPSDMLTIGKNIVQGLWNGITASKSWLLNNIKSWCGSVLDGVKSFFGVHSPSLVFKEIGSYLVQGLGLGISEEKGYAVNEIEKLGNAILNTGDAISTGLISVSEKTGTTIYSNLYKNMMKRLTLYDKERNQRIAAMEGATEDNIAAINREVEATRTATDAKIKLYQQEYAAKISLIDDETSAATKALQTQIDAINAQQEQENRAEEELEYMKKMQDLQLEYDSAETAEERYNIEMQIAEAERSRKKQLLQQERQDKIESLRDEMEAIREQANQKKAALQEELEAKQYQLEQQRLREIEYMQQVIALMQEQVDKRKELEEVQTKIASKEKELQTKKMDAETKKQTKIELTELKEQEKNLKDAIANNEKTLQDFLPKVQDLSNQYGDAFLSGFKSTESQIKNYISSIVGFGQSQLATLATGFAAMKGFSVNGSHKTGLSYVPFDGYIAELHKGERVLTAGENRAYSNGGNTIQNVFNVQATIREESDIKRVAQELYQLQRNTSRGRGIVMA